MSAPVQLLTVGVANAQVPAPVIAEFTRLHDARIVRILDVLFAHHTDDGDVDSVERVDADGMQFDGTLLTALLTADSEGPTAGGGATWSMQDAIPRGQTAALVLVEHLWAEALATSLLASGGQMFDELWLSSEDREALDALRTARG
jgi:hypothetical protein